MKKLNKNTQKAQNRINAYNSSSYFIGETADIYQVYYRPSMDKLLLLKKCISFIDSVGGETIKIISHSIQQYTLGYLTTKDNKKYLNIITRSNCYEIEL